GVLRRPRHAPPVGDSAGPAAAIAVAVLAHVGAPSDGPGRYPGSAASGPVLRATPGMGVSATSLRGRPPPGVGRGTVDGGQEACSGRSPSRYWVAATSAASWASGSSG